MPVTQSSFRECRRRRRHDDDDHAISAPGYCLSSQRSSARWPKFTILADTYIFAISRLTRRSHLSLHTKYYIAVATPTRDYFHLYDGAAELRLFRAKSRYRRFPARAAAGSAPCTFVTSSFSLCHLDIIAHISTSSHSAAPRPLHMKEGLIQYFLTMRMSILTICCAAASVMLRRKISRTA